MVVSEKKVIILYSHKKCVNLNLEWRSGSFNDGFHRFWLFSIASVATPVLCEILPSFFLDS